MGTISHPGAPLGGIVVDRVVETAVGVALAFAALWLLLPGAFRRALLWSDRRVLELTDRLLTVLRSENASAAATMELRRDIQFELVGAALAGAEAAHNDRRWAHRVWDRHAEVDHLGYELLARCWTADDVGRPNDIDQWQRRHDTVTGKFDSRTLG
jgi:uncharacterized membrane protein YccC